MKRLFFFLVLCSSFLFTWGQVNSKYNSLCLFKDTTYADYLVTSIDSITFVNRNDSIYQSLWFGDRSDLKNICEIDSVIFFNPYVDGILEINQHIDFWDYAYVTPIGYFCYKTSLPYENDSADNKLYEMLSYVNFEKTEQANIVMSKEYMLPAWMMVDSLSVYFTYSQDSLCSMEIGRDSTIIGTLEFEYNDSIVHSDNKYSTHNLKRNLWILVSLLDGNVNEYDEIASLIEKFKMLLELEDKEDSLTDIPILKGSYVFTNQGYSPKFLVGEIYYTVVVMTGQARDIKATSAKLEGAVRCASSRYNNHGTYGILCDKNPENLSLGTATHNFVGHQEKLSLSFNVNASNLKYNTQYYYRTYFRITGKSDLKYRYGKDIAANATYGKVRSFKTLCPSVTTGDVIDVSTTSVNLNCTFDNITNGIECGVVISDANGKETKTTIGTSNGKQEVNISGLDPATTYEYYGYVKIGEDVITGETKSFTTEMPDISGTWTCTETHYNLANNPYYVTYSLTLNRDGTVSHSEHPDIPSSSWSFSASGKVNISVITIATQAHTSGTNWEGTVDDVKNPTTITGSTSNWNYNQIGSFVGEGHSFIMTK